MFSYQLVEVFALLAGYAREAETVLQRGYEFVCLFAHPRQPNASLFSVMAREAHVALFTAPPCFAHLAIPQVTAKVIWNAAAQ